MSEFIKSLQSYLTSTDDFIGLKLILNTFQWNLDLAVTINVHILKVTLILASKMKMYIFKACYPYPQKATQNQAMFKKTTRQSADCLAKRLKYKNTQSKRSSCIVNLKVEM